MSFQTPSKAKRCTPAKSYSKSSSFTTPGKKAGVALLFAAGCVVDQAAAFTARSSRSVCSASFSRCRKVELSSSIAREMNNYQDYEGDGDDGMIPPPFFSSEADDVVYGGAVERFDWGDTTMNINEAEPFFLSIEPDDDDVDDEESVIGRLERIFQQASALIEEEERLTEEEERLTSFYVPVFEEASESTIAPENPDALFHFSRGASISERIERSRKIYNGNPEYIGIPANPMGVGTASWK